MSIYVQLAVALGLGLLVGLQRQHAHSQMAGIRTFPLITLLGAVCALLGQSLGGWVVAAGLVGIAAIIVVSNLLRTTGEAKRDRGMTTEAAALLMYGVGAAVTAGYVGPAVVVGALVAVLLQAKEPLHQLVSRMGEKDMRAIYQFVLISMVILPVLPDRAYGPLEVLNPYRVWLMVVLIVGIGLAGYVAYKLVGDRAGALLGGVLGGVISSTATTVSYARRTAESGNSAGVAAAVIMVASTVAFVRVLVEVAAVAPQTLGTMAPPLGAMLGVMAMISAAYFWRFRGEKSEAPEQENPTELKPALIFGVLYAVVLFAVAAVKAWVGDAGLWVVAVLSGLTDMDAITLSTAQMAGDQGLDAAMGWRIILTASMSNLVFKAGAVAVLGDRRLFERIAVLYGLAIVGGVLILVLWPR